MIIDGRIHPRPRQAQGHSHLHIQLNQLRGQHGHKGRQVARVPPLNSPLLQQKHRALRNREDHQLRGQTAEEPVLARGVLRGLREDFQPTHKVR